MNELFWLIALILIGVATSAVVYVVFSNMEEKNRFRNAMKAAQGFSADGTAKGDNDAEDFKDRVIAPAWEKLGAFARSRTPVGYMDRIRVKMIQLGKPDSNSIDGFLAFRLFTLLLVPVILILFLVIGIARPLVGGLNIYLVLFLLLFTILGPDAILNKKVDDRKQKIQEQLPDILDLLTISVEAGLGFEQAVDRVISNVPGPFSEEMSRMLGESRSGMSRSEAFRALDQRVAIPEVHSFVLAILQGDKFGVSIGRVLRLQSEEMRIKRKQQAQEKAQKAPVKLLIPTAFCIFPVLFIIVLGPAVLRIMEGGV